MFYIKNIIIIRTKLSKRFNYFLKSFMLNYSASIFRLLLTDHGITIGRRYYSLSYSSLRFVLILYFLLKLR